MYCHLLGKIIALRIHFYALTEDNITGESYVLNILPDVPISPGYTSLLYKKKCRKFPTDFRRTLFSSHIGEDFEASDDFLEGN